MSDLRAAVEGLRRFKTRDGATWPWVNQYEVLDLIPEGAVLVTEETRDHAKYLAQAASHLADHLKEQYPTFYCEDLDNVRHFAAAILARISDD